MARPLKIIIDTDPGVDDTFAILLALRSPEVEVVGITSLFGNVRTKMATQNALYILEKFGRPDIPVYEGHHTSIVGEEKERIADFVHGDDGFGNTNPPPPSGKMVEGKSAAEFIVETANAYPGEVTVVALASATNVTLALRADCDAVVKNLREIVHLGGAFFVNGNVNPSAEANIFDEHAEFLMQISRFYMRFHVDTTGMEGIFMHDPAAILLAFRPELFGLRRGKVRVATEGLCRGMTVMDSGHKRWTFENAWHADGRPDVSVALDVDVERVMRVFRERYGIVAKGAGETVTS